MLYLMFVGALALFGRVQCSYIESNSTVACGAHRALSCALCPKGHGAVWCHGECFWDNGVCVHRGISGEFVVHAIILEDVNLEWYFGFSPEEYVYVEIQKVTSGNEKISRIAFKPRHGRYVIHESMRREVEVTDLKDRFGVRLTFLDVAKKEEGIYQCLVKLRKSAEMRVHSTALNVHGQHSVSCGHHEAPECALCPREHGPNWCNGECFWDNGKCVRKGIRGERKVHAKTWEKVSLEWTFDFPETEYVYIEIQKVASTGEMLIEIAFKDHNKKGFIIDESMKGRVNVSLITEKKFGVRMSFLKLGERDSGLYQCVARLRRGSYLLRHSTEMEVEVGGPCVPDPCNGRGKCTTPTTKTYMCHCYQGYTGLNCQIYYEPLGCFQDSFEDRALPIKFQSFRDRIDWDHIDKTIKQCSDYANKVGYKVFGIQFYGECWSGPHAETTYNKHGPSTNCWEGVGAELTNFVYHLHNKTSTDMN